MRLWVIGALVAAGLAAGIFVPGGLAATFKTATFQVFLPAIIFEAAWQLELRVMRLAWRPIAVLALPGVIVTAAIIAGVAYFLGGLSLPAALVLGAVLSATDPIAVTAIFRRLPVPHELATIVESESLLNDAIAVVLYRALLAAIVASALAPVRIEAAAVHALAGSFLGAAVGAAAGWAGAMLLRRSLPVPLQLLGTFACAYGVYFASEALNWSGIFAVLSCAIAMRQVERSSSAVQMRRSVQRAWDVAAVLSNAALFFLIGASVEVAHLWALRVLIFWTLVAVLISRVLVSYGLLQLVPQMRRSWMDVVRMAGVRGAISLALALSIPSSVPQARLVVDATFVVVVVTLLVGALTYERRVIAMDLRGG